MQRLRNEGEDQHEQAGSRAQHIQPGHRCPPFRPIELCFVSARPLKPYRRIRTGRCIRATGSRRFLSVPAVLVDRQVLAMWRRS